MYLMILMIILMLFSNVLASVFKRRFEEVLPIAIMGIIFTLYVFGIFSNLLIGVYFILLLSGIALVWSIYVLIKRKKESVRMFFTPGLIIFLLFMIYTWWAHRGRVITLWDEFSHWGLTVKNMYVLDVLGNMSIATTTFKSYPPGIALFQYFIQKLSGSFIEANLYRAVNILAISLLLPIFSLVSWKDYKKIPALFFIIMILPLTFYYEFYHTIYVDAILGVIFSYVLYTYFSNKLNCFSLISISLGLGMLILTKESGFGIAAIAMIIILIDLVIYNRHQIVTFVKRNILINKLVLISPFMMLVFAKYSWSTYLIASETEQYWDNGGITLQNILNLYSNDVPFYRKQTILNFFNAIFTDKMTGFMLDINFIGIVIIMIFMGIGLIYLTPKKDKAKFKMGLSICLIGGIIYSASLLFIYLFTYDENEALGLASLLRYLGTYLTGIFIFLNFMLLKRSLEGNYKFSKYTYLIIISGLLVIVNVKPLVNTTLLAPYYIDQANEYRAPYLEMEKVLDVLNPAEDKVYLIAQNNRSGHLTARYMLTPIHINSYEYSLGEPYGDDPYTWNITPEEWCERLKGYDYVYLFQIDDKFKDAYHSLFESIEEIRNDSLYKIIKDEDVLKLIKVDV